MNFTILNLGCKVNAYEAEAVAEEMVQKGWKRVSEKEECDAAVIFTCAVTNTASAKSRKALNQIIRRFPHAITVVAGCYAQMDDGLLNEANILVGTANKRLIPSYIEEFQKNHRPIHAIENLSREPFEPLKIDHLENHSRGVLKIEDGCNQFCSYCIIPYVRGRERSLSPDEVIAQAKRIAVHQHEIVLTGIHTGRYGREYNVSLASLMKRMLDEVPDIYRLRLSSIEITEINDELIELMHSDKRIARHLHIPLQAGSDSVLKAMRRPYDTKYYYDRIEYVRSAVDDIAVSTDIMTGFPGETDAQFEETMAFLKKCRFSFLHVFPFSSRQGTPAADMPCQIDPSVKKERARKCIALSHELHAQYTDSWIGREVEMMSEKPEDGSTPGYTSQYVRAEIKDKEYPRGTLIKGKAVSRNGEALEIEVES